MTRLALIGGGRMGEALLGGLIAAQWADPADLCVVEQVDERRAVLEDRFEKVSVVAEIGAVSDAEGAVIAVKPNDVEAVCRELGAAGVGRVLSIAAGVTLERLEGALPAGTPVVRAMPNTPALVGAGAAAIAGGAAATAADLDWAESILGSVGVVYRVDESMLDAVTGLSGSGPAYVFLVAEALIEAGVQVGLSAEVSNGLAIQTILGSARMLAETGEVPAALRAAVTSPGGTTEAGLRVLEEAVRAAFLEAVAAATERSRELGRG